MAGFSAVHLMAVLVSTEAEIWRVKRLSIAVQLGQIQLAVPLDAQLHSRRQLVPTIAEGQRLLRRAPHRAVAMGEISEPGCHTEA
jgi:hypothetical protein